MRRFAGLLCRLRLSAGEIRKTCGYVHSPVENGAESLHEFSNRKVSYDVTVDACLKSQENIAP